MANRLMTPNQFACSATFSPGEAYAVWMQRNIGARLVEYRNGAWVMLDEIALGRSDIDNICHEVRFGMGLLPYLLSKLVLLSGLALTQTAVLLWVIRYFTELTGGFPIQFVAIAVTAAVGFALGLLVSATAGSSERAMTILPVVPIMQAIFSGGIARLEGVIELLAQVTVPAYWALDGIRSTFSTSLTTATYLNAPGSFMPPILGSGEPVALDLLALLIHGTVFSVLAYLVLRFKFHG